MNDGPFQPGNSLIITKDNILANNFTLQKGNEQLTLQGESQQLNVRFTNFQLGTITGFMKSDTILANGSLNGTIAFKNILRQAGSSPVILPLMI
jgi:hypothetical protein